MSGKIGRSLAASIAEFAGCVFRCSDGIWRARKFGDDRDAELLPAFLDLRSAWMSLVAVVCVILMAAPAYAASTFAVEIDKDSPVQPVLQDFQADGWPHTVVVDLRQATSFRLSAAAVVNPMGFRRFYVLYRTAQGGVWRSLSATGCGGLDAAFDATVLPTQSAGVSGVCPIAAGARASGVELKIGAGNPYGPRGDYLFPRLTKDAVVQFFVP